MYVPTKETPYFLIKISKISRYDEIFVKKCQEMLFLFLNGHGFRYKSKVQNTEYCVLIDFIHNSYTISHEPMNYDKIFEHSTIYNMNHIVHFIQSFNNDIIKYKLSVLINENIS